MPYRPSSPTARLRSPAPSHRSSRWPATAALATVGLTLALACGSPYPPPPDTVREPVVDTLHGVAITDDYRWLEDQDSPETRAWIAAQNAYAEQIVGDTPLRSELAARLRELMDVQGAVFPGGPATTSTSRCGSRAARSLPSTGAPHPRSARKARWT